LCKDVCMTPSVRKLYAGAVSPGTLASRQTLTALAEIAIALDRAHEAIDLLVEDVSAAHSMADDQAGTAVYRGRHRAPSPVAGG
jgi:hypothetical protein